MNKKFEQEYREMMNKEIPDLWDRIEAGVKASPRSNSVITGIDDLRKEKEVRKEKKRGSNYYQIMAVAGVAACFAVLAVGAPAVKQSMQMEKEAVEGRTEADIELEDGTSSSSSTQSGTSSSSEKEETKFNDQEDKESSSIQAADSSSAEDAEETSSKKKKKKPDKDREKDDSSATASELAKDDNAEAQSDQSADSTSALTQSASEQASSSTEQAAESTSKKKSKKTSSSTAEEAVTSDADAETGKPESDVGVVASIASTDPDSQASTVETEVPEAAEKEKEKEEAESKEPVVYTGVVAKVTSVKESDGAVIYTFKVVSDENGNFSKNKKIKVVGGETLEKGLTYLIAFSDDGTKKGSSPLYKMISASETESEQQ